MDERNGHLFGFAVLLSELFDAPQNGLIAVAEVVDNDD
jgi:hypothetical protein